MSRDIRTSLHCVWRHSHEDVAYHMTNNTSVDDVFDALDGEEELMVISK